MKWIFSGVFLITALKVIGQEYYFRQMPLDFDGDIQTIGLLFQGRDQMIWIGTDQGLYSFDGRKYRHIARPDKVDHEVTAIAEKTNGEIWAGYDDGIIQTISAFDLSRIIKSDSIKGVKISKILFQHDGDTFIVTYSAGIWRIHENQFTKLKFSSLDKIDDIYDALFDNQNRLWLATDRGIWIYQQNPGEELRHLGLEQGLPDEIVNKLIPGVDGNIWIAMYDHGLAEYQAYKDSIVSMMTLKSNDVMVKSLKPGQAGDVWLATEKSIERISFNSPVHRIQLPADINERIEDLLFDYTGNLWIATGNKLFMANTQLEHRLPDVTGIQSIAPLQGHLWLGCKSGLYSMNENNGEITQHLQQEQLNILTIYADASGLLWIGTFGQGLYLFDPNTGRSRHLTENDHLSNNSILNIDGEGHRLWLATLGGITEIDWTSDPFTDKLSIIDFQDKYDFPAGYVFDVYVSKDDKVWFGTDGKGLYYLDKNQLYPFERPMVLPGQDSFDLRTIYSITGDDHNNLWISSTKGNILNFDLNGNILEHITSSHGSDNSLITSGKGEIIMVQEGVIQVKNPLFGVFQYSTSTGLPTFSPSTNAVSRDKDGSIWIADTDNILHYIPSLTDTAWYVHLHLTDISHANAPENETIQLKPDSNFLDFKFTGLWYLDPSRVQYRYMLKGHDQNWIYTQEGRAVYSKLSPGTYTFLVAGSYNDDFSQSPQLTRRIVVLPPFYLTWWFISGIILFISLVTYLSIRARIRNINKWHQLEKEKTTLQLHAIQAQVNPHFLFNSFNTLSNIIEEDQKSAVAYVDQLSGFFRGVLMHRAEELISIEDELIIMRNYAYILQKRYGDNIRIIENIESHEGYIAPLSIQLLVENAIKHNKVANEKPLTIRIDINDHLVVVSNPIQPKIQSIAESTGFGLSSLLIRYQYLTPIKVEVINDGNSFTVKIPIIHLNDVT